MTVLLGNTYPITLVNRPARIIPISKEEAQHSLEEGYVSFWGHANSASAASDFIGFDVRPKTERPAITLDDNDYPTLDGVTSDTVIVISPEYAPGYRPGPNEEVTLDKISGWKIRKIIFS